MKMGRALTGPESGLADLIMDYVGSFSRNEYKILMLSVHMSLSSSKPHYDLFMDLAEDRMEWINRIFNI